MPRPKKSFHRRLTKTRAVSGLSWRGEPAGQVEPRLPLRRRFSGTLAAGSRATPGCTTSPESSSQLPRGRMRTVRGAADIETSVVGNESHRGRSARLRSLAICSRTGASSGAMLRKWAASLLACLRRALVGFGLQCRRRRRRASRRREALGLSAVVSDRRNRPMLCPANCESCLQLDDAASSRPADRLGEREDGGVIGRLLVASDGPAGVGLAVDRLAIG